MLSHLGNVGCQYEETSALNEKSEPRRAFITGASVGLGQAIAVALARDGYELALTDLTPA